MELKKLAELAADLEQQAKARADRQLLENLLAAIKQQAEPTLVALDKLPDTRSETAAATPAEEDTPGALKENLAQLLADRDLNALEQFTALHRAMGSQSSDPRWLELERLVKKLDFAKAAALLAKQITGPGRTGPVCGCRMSYRRIMP